ncbi:MAG: nuclear transport factor 2 family protein [Pseudomonadota bacterium]
MFPTLALLLAQPAVTPPSAPIPPIEETAKRIEARDARLFWYAFEGCNAARLETFLAPDFRMLHDLGGVVADNRDAFMEGAEQQCAARLPGGANEGYKNRRLLVPGSDQVTPLGNWGVLHRGYHTFHEWRGPEAGWEQVGGAYFINVWQWNAVRGVFEMQETISVDHGASTAYPPAGGDEEAK